jgi:hypothetical protein
LVEKTGEKIKKTFAIYSEKMVAESPSSLLVGERSRRREVKKRFKRDILIA